MLSPEALKLFAGQITLFSLIWCLFFNVVPYHLVVSKYAGLALNLQDLWYLFAGNFGPPFILVWMFYSRYGIVEEGTAQRNVEEETSILTENDHIVSYF